MSETAQSYFKANESTTSEEADKIQETKQTMSIGGAKEGKQLQWVEWPK